MFRACLDHNLERSEGKSYACRGNVYQIIHRWRPWCKWWRNYLIWIHCLANTLTISTRVWPWVYVYNVVVEYCTFKGYTYVTLVLWTSSQLLLLFCFTAEPHMAWHFKFLSSPVAVMHSCYTQNFILKGTQCVLTVGRDNIA